MREPCTVTRANGGRVDRYYDPSTDQFLNVDPLAGVTGQPYAFTGDDRVNWSDPLGLMPGCGGQVGNAGGSDSLLSTHHGRALMIFRKYIDVTT
jgi:hypothetical protein